MLIPPHIQPILYVVAMGAVCWMLMKRNSGRLERNRRQNNRFDTRPTPNTITNAAPSSALALNNAPAEVSRWTIELFDQMRDWQGELQSKSIVLQSLLKMAQEETARLEARLAELRDESYSGSRSPVRRAAARYELDYATDNRSNYASTTPFFDPQLVERAYRLADEGKSLSEIAARLGKSSADTEFLLSFRSR